MADHAKRYLNFSVLKVQALEHTGPVLSKNDVLFKRDLFFIFKLLITFFLLLLIFKNLVSSVMAFSFGQGTMLQNLF